MTVSVSNVINATCQNCNGAITINPSGGTQPLSFHWSNNTSVENPLNLCSGNYFVTVTDNAGCTAITQATVQGTARNDESHVCSAKSFLYL